jgi:tetratricopeptide (TPR) repeat protein
MNSYDHPLGIERENKLEKTMKTYTHRVLTIIGVALVTFLMVGNLEAARADTRKGLAAAKKQQWEEAVAAFTRAIESQPKNATHYINRGQALRADGKLKQAHADFTRAIELKPRDATPYTLRGQVSLDQKRVDRAIEDFDQALKISPRDRSARRFRAFAHMIKKDWKKAIADYDVAITTVRQVDVEGRMRRGFAHRNLKQYDDAIEDFSRIIQASPKNADFYRYRADTYALMGENEKAVADMKRVVELKPQDKEAQRRLAALQRSSGADARKAATARPEPAAGGTERAARPKATPSPSGRG